MKDCNFCQSVRGWLSKPFDEDGSALDWFLFVGLVAIIAWFWTRVLQRVLR